MGKAKASTNEEPPRRSSRKNLPEQQMLRKNLLLQKRQAKERRPNKLKMGSLRLRSQRPKPLKPNE